MPNGYGEEHETLTSRPSRIKHHVTYEESRKFLKKHGILIHPGIPVYESHHDFLKEIEQDNDDKEQEQIEIDYNDVKAPDLPKPRRSKEEAKLKLQSLYKNDSPSSIKKTSSEDSLAEQQRVEKTKKINASILQFAKEAGISLIVPKSDFDETHPKTQQKKIKIFRQVMRLIAAYLAPSNPEGLINAATKPKTEEPQKVKKTIDIILSMVKAQYNVAETSSERIEVLSQIAAGLDYETLSNLISGITHYSYLKARLLAKMREDALKVPKEKFTRTKYNQHAVNLFIEFITSSAIMIGLPYGSRTAKLPGGEKYDIPNTIRKQQDAEIIKMFKHYLIQTGNDHIKISNSVLRKLLKVCSASRLKSMHCVDYYEAASNEAFDKIESCLKSMSDLDYLTSDTEKYLTKKLLEAKRYLKTDYPLHLKMHSRIPEHCISYALSDPNDAAFCSPPCDSLDNDAHAHDYSCDRCQIFPEFMNEIKEILQYHDPAEEELNEFEGEIIKAENDILEWKKHVLRAAFSELQRVEIIENLKENEALITIDYSQKYLPQKHYESQKDYYGKKGMSWHICHIFAKKNGKLIQHAIVHLLGFEDQTSKAVAAILRDAFEKCKKWDIKSVTLRSDNAGYYRNASLVQSLLMISKNSGIVLKRYSFSEVQAGKSAADREGSRMKRKMKDALSDKHDIETPIQMLEAIRYGQEPISGTTIIVASVISPQKENENAPSIPGISLLSDFEYDVENMEITFWKHHGIGQGKKIKLTQDNILTTELDIKMATEESPETEGYEFWRTKNSITKKVSKSKGTVPPIEAESDSDNDDVDNVHEIINIQKSLPSLKPSALFICPIPSCQKRYVKLGNLMNHIDEGKHKLLPEKARLYDYALNYYGDQLEGLQKQNDDYKINESIEESVKQDNTDVLKGWALRTTTRNKKFSSDVHKFVEEQMENCKVRGKRLDPKKCEKNMELAKHNGKRRFKVDERLSSSQISSLVLRKMNKISGENVIINEKNKQAKRSAINKELEEETGEMEIEFEDDPLFPDIFEKVHSFTTRSKNIKKDEIDEEGEEIDEEEESDEDQTTEDEEENDENVQPPTKQKNASPKTPLKRLRQRLSSPRDDQPKSKSSKK